MTGLLTVLRGTNRDKVRVYGGEQVTGSVVQERGAHAHKGVEGRIVELADEKYAWFKAQRGA